MLVRVEWETTVIENYSATIEIGSLAELAAKLGDHLDAEGQAALMEGDLGQLNGTAYGEWDGFVAAREREIEPDYVSTDDREVLKIEPAEA